MIRYLLFVCVIAMATSVNIPEDICNSGLALLTVTNPATGETVTCGSLENKHHFKNTITVKIPDSLIGQSKKYTLIMVDPDAPSPQNPKKKYWLHWIVSGIQGTEVSSGNTVVDYTGPTPPQGKHRYQLFLFLQSASSNVEEYKLSSRGSFKVKEFAEEYNLSGPVAAMQFNCNP